MSGAAADLVLSKGFSSQAHRERSWNRTLIESQYLSTEITVNRLHIAVTVIDNSIKFIILVGCNQQRSGKLQIHHINKSEKTTKIIKQ